jgi:phosphoenolpyruvate carboxykinase (ATP)
LLGEKLRRHHSHVWLVNTGWSGGPYGIGERIALPYTRAMVRAALSGALDSVPMRIDPYFGIPVPEACPGVPAEILDPAQSYHDLEDYHTRAKALAGRFHDNFAQFAGHVPVEVAEAGPVR